MLSQLFAISLVSIVVYMTLWFAIARYTKRLDAVDSAWGLGFVLLAWLAELSKPSNHSLVIALLVTIWGVRLFGHITKRSMGRHQDPRYVELAQKWRGNFWLRAYLSIFLLQAVLVWVISLPVMLATGQQLGQGAWLTAVGALLWIVGFSIEATADRQLARYLHLPNRPKVLMTGLWHYSRHPNYFGELMQWWAIAVIALQVSYGWVGLAGPLLLTILIVFVSGIPPIEKRRAKDPEYTAYQARTSPLIPWPPRLNS